MFRQSSGDESSSHTTSLSASTNRLPLIQDNNVQLHGLFSPRGNSQKFIYIETSEQTGYIFHGDKLIRELKA